MLRLIGCLVAAWVLFSVGSAQAQVVISQVYAGTTPFSVYRSAFIELHNTGSTSVNLTGWSVQYANSISTTWSVTSLNGSIAPGGYYLIGQSTGPADPTLPATDAHGNVAMQSGGGKVALLSNQIPLTTACTASPAPPVMDLVGYGGTVTTLCGEFAPTPGLNDITAAVRRNNGCTDTNNNSTDFVLTNPNARNTLTVPVLCITPTLNISDAAAPEGNGPGSSFSAQLVATLDAPAPAGGVRFNANTSNGTATADFPGNPTPDYVAQNWQIVIPEGETTKSLVISIIGDTDVEADETLAVTISNLQGATLGDAVGVYTIVDDDANTETIAANISEIQGTDLTSPFVGRHIRTEGIVTALRANDGFFLQSINDDGNPTTSEGIFISTFGVPVTGVAIGDHLRVTGRVIEFVPSNDLNQLSVTQLVSPTVELLASGVMPPAPIILTSADFNPGSVPGSAEKYEGMRVATPSLRVTQGTAATIDEANATSTNTGDFYAVMPGISRPFREPGIGVLDMVPIPAGKNPPRFDTNPERLMVRSKGQAGANALVADVDAEVSGLVGVLDYVSGTWALLPDPSATISVNGGKQPRAVPDARQDEIAIANINLRRFWDDINDGNENLQLTPAAFEKRLNKASAAICDYLKAPDILGVQEVEHLRALEALATRINNTCPRAPAYRAYLIPGANADVRNIGFLISARQLPNSTNRVDVYQVEQIGANATFSSSDFFSTPLPLFERPPLRLFVAVNHPNGTRYPLLIYLNHFSPRDGIDSIAPGLSGWATLSEHVRARRAGQATFLKNDIRLQQLSGSGSRIVALGDFNAFDFSDGYVDVIGTLKGNPAPANQVLTPTTSDLLFPFASSNEFVADPTERYSSMVVGTARTLEHILVSQPIVIGASSIRVDYARINADFAASHYGDVNSPVRVGERDPVRMTIRVPDFRTADLGIEITDISPATPRVGQPLSFTATVTNHGPNDAAFPGVSLLVFGPRTTAVRYTVAAPDGWNCAPSPISSGGFDTTAVCSTTSLPAGASASFTMSFVMPPEMANQTMQLAAAARSQTADLISANNVFTTPSFSVIAEADLSVQWTGGNELPLYSGAQRDFLLSMKHLGPDPIASASVTFTIDDAPTGTVEFYANNWFCTPDYSSATVRTVCDYSYFFAQGPIEPGSETPFIVRVLAAPLPDADGLNLSATVSGAAFDANSGNNQANLSMPVALTNADLSVQWTKVPAAPLRSGVTSMFALTLHNAGPDQARRSSLIVTVDAPLNDVAIEPPGEGWFCTTDYSDYSRFVIECINSYDRPIAVGESMVFNLLVRAPLPDADGLNVSATISSIGTDDNPSNDSSARSVAVKLANADLSAKWSGGPTGRYRPGDTAEFVLTLDNRGHDAAWAPSVTISVDAPFENVTFNDSGYWSCEGDYSTADFKINCLYGIELAPHGQSPSVFILQVVAPSRDKDKLNLKAMIDSAYVRDSNRGNNTSRRHQNINGFSGEHEGSPED